MIQEFLRTFNLSLKGLVSYLPALLGGIVVFAITIFASNVLSRLVARYSLRRTKDPLVSNFIAKSIWAISFILGTVLTLGILGLGTISNKILAGAGITTFVIGFALKDIGENFLSGLILAFSRPYHIGNLIECVGVKGIVRDMTLRQTTVESDDGKMIMIPNASIIKNPLSRYTTVDELSQVFTLKVDPSDAEKAIAIIEREIHSYAFVHAHEEKKPKVIAEELSGDKVKLTVIFWFNPERFQVPRIETRSKVMLQVVKKLQEENVSFSG